MTLIYLFGVTWLAGWYLLIGGLSMRDALVFAVAIGSAPFIVWDIVKLLVAMLLARSSIVIYMYVTNRGNEKLER